MATTVAPAQETIKKAPLMLTPQAIAKVREIMATQDPLPAGLRIGVVGGGCSGFQYSMAFENQSGMMDKVFSFDDLKVFVDATSLMYLNGCTVDYVETLEAAGFKFENPQVKSHLRLRIFVQCLNGATAHHGKGPSAISGTGRFALEPGSLSQELCLAAG